MSTAPQEETENGQPKNFTNEDVSSTTWVDKWSNFVLNIIQKYPVGLLKTITKHAATHPVRYVVGIPLLSIAILVIGLFTNFKIDTDEDVLWTPTSSRALSHGKWIDDVAKSGFPEEDRYFTLLVHADGENVLGMEGVERTFDAVEAVTQTEGYKELCAKSTHESIGGNETTCPIDSITSFWDDSRSQFEQSITNETEVIRAMSALKYPNGEPVDRLQIFGISEYNNSNENDTVPLLTSVLSFSTNIGLPPFEKEAEKFEKKALDNIFALNEKWENENGNHFRVEVFAERSFGDEFGRAVEKDIPLIPLVFVIMSVFCCVVFFKRNKVRSKTLLGFGAVVTVLLAIMSGYGICFTAGVAFTSLTQILPFIMFGIGLDDAFILSGAFERTDPQKDVVGRVVDMIEEAGASVLVTTLTTFVAFVLGCQSTIPAVRWLCFYAFPTVLIDFIYQVTFFVALMAIDDKRVRDNRYDCLVCFRSSSSSPSNSEAERETKEPFFTRLMSSYADILLRPVTKVLVVLVFIALFIVGVIYASRLKQEFDFTDMVPAGSYVTKFVDAYDDYAEEQAFRPGVYFRDVDVSSPDVQDAMQSYIKDLVGIKHISNPPTFFWLDDFNTFVTKNNETLSSKPFTDQMTSFLDDPIYNKLYADDIVRNDEGVITASRTFVVMDMVDSFDVENQIDALKDQRDVSNKQPLNKDQSDWRLFTFEGSYYIWEFYSVAVEELILSTILGVVAVAIIALLFIPHPTGTLFVTPLVMLIYVELLGLLKIAGLAINAVTYIGMVMSIGLMVDYVMHVVFKYFEADAKGREEKVREVLTTMGTSVLIGGASTMLGIIPLAFSTSEIFSTIFVIFVGIVVIGLGHGLVLLPVILSIVGPMHCGSSNNTKVGKEEVVVNAEKRMENP